MEKIYFRIKRGRIIFVINVTMLLLFIFHPVKLAEAYIGPGAGFALVSSFTFLIAAVFIAFFSIITWPLRSIILYLRQRKTRQNSKVRRIVIIGFDGMDPDLCSIYIKENKLKHMKMLSDTGCFSTLQTTTPAISPVAWSTFATGVNPGKHGIFDFFTRDVRTYLPVLSSTLIASSKKVIKFGPYRLLMNNTTVKLLRKSTSVWKILGKKKIFSTILRVPITFPSEKFYGVCLSAMCTPDLRGTQGSYTYFSSNTQDTNRDKTDTTHDDLKHDITVLDLEGNSFVTEIVGPVIERKGMKHPLMTEMKGRVNQKGKSVQLYIGKETITLNLNEYSPWVRIVFKLGFRKKIQGIVKFLVTEIDPLHIYMTPINIDPEKPNMPISYPSYYSISLSKIHGPFSTLGLAEDTSALNDGIIDEKAFLRQAYDIYEERKKIFIDNLKKTKQGLVVSVFDTTDRIQHMFFRYLCSDHPANSGKDTTVYKNTIEMLYRKMDDLVGVALKEIGKNDLLLIISDHGFKQFKWGINLNTFLWEEGYLVLKDGFTPDGKWFANVDWNLSKAYAYGLSGIFINTKGREKNGIIEPGEDKKVFFSELTNKLKNLYDKKNNCRPIRRIIETKKELHGPYVSEAPDIIVGYEEGYRASWNCAVGKITDRIFEENTKHWSGDHCIDPELVPGVLFSNWNLNDENPSLCDIAPTILNMFGLKKKQFQDGKVLNFYPHDNT